MKLILPLILFATLATAQDDCSMSADSIKGAIDSKSKAIKKFTPGKVHNRTYSETANMKDDMIVTYTYGGCEHQAISWEFLNFGKLPENDKAKIIDFVIAKLESVPVTYKYAKNVFVEALKKEKATPKKFAGSTLELSCGEGSTCALEADKSRIFLSYDFAL